MSSTLYWYPNNPPKGRDLSDELKFALRKKYGNPINVIIGNNDMDYLEGLRDANIKDVYKLISAIEKYGIIELKEVC